MSCTGVLFHLTGYKGNIKDHEVFGYFWNLCDHITIGKQKGKERQTTQESYVSDVSLIQESYSTVPYPELSCDFTSDKILLFNCSNLKTLWMIFHLHMFLMPDTCISEICFLPSHFLFWYILFSFIITSTIKIIGKFKECLGFLKFFFLNYMFF